MNKYTFKPNLQSKITIFMLVLFALIAAPSIQGIPLSYAQSNSSSSSSSEIAAFQNITGTTNEQLGADQSMPSDLTIKITSHTNGQKVPVGKLTLSGESSDDSSTDCKVYVDRNNEKPYQNVTATGPFGIGDYSTWTFNYTLDNKIIQMGPNELTAKLECNTPTGVQEKWNTVTLIGVTPDTPLIFPKDKTGNN